MAVLKNRAKMSTSTTGTGTITLGSAESGYQTFADAGVANADVVRYVIEDTGGAFEIGTGTYTSSGTTLSRTVSESSNSDAAINLSGSATVFIGATAEDIPALYAENYDGTSTLPSATGTNALALQDGAVASANRSIAVGRDAVSSGNYAVALGVYTDAINSFGTALGYKAQTASSDYATALTNSRASGSNSFAAAIANNTSTYGASGSNSVPIGNQAKSTGLGSVAIGYGAPLAQGNVSFATQRGQATGGGSIAMGHFNTYGFPTASGLSAIVIGDGNTGSATRSVVLGNDSTSSHTDAIVIGGGASSSAADQITLGHTDQTVRISSSYTLPTSDGSANQVLTTDGSGAVTFADAGGGGGSPNLFAENYDGTSTLPSATGTNAVAIGLGSVSSGLRSVAIGNLANASSLRGFAVGVNSAASGSNAISMGANSASSGSASVAIGTESSAASDNSFALGYQAKTVTGSQATAVGYRAYASGTDSFAAATGDTTSAYGSAGNYSVAIGRQAKATGTSAHAFGSSSTGNIASGNNSFASGVGATASGNSTIAMGSSVTADGYHSIAKGAYGDVNGVQYREAFGFGTDYQRSIFVLQDTTSDATATILSTNGNASAISAATQIVLPNNSAYSFSGTIIARESAAAGSDYASWEIKGALLRDANAASTVLGNGIQNKLYATSGASAWAIALTADTTNGGLKIEVTGAASTNIRWAATVNTSEVTYA